MRTVVSGSLAGQRPPRDVAGRLETRKSRGEACGLTHGRTRAALALLALLLSLPETS